MRWPGRGEGDAGFAGHQRAGAVGDDRAHPRLVADQAGAHHAIALGGGQEGVAQADQAAGWDGELQPDAAAAVVDHVEHPRAAGADQLADRRRRTLRRCR